MLPPVRSFSHRASRLRRAPIEILDVRPDRSPLVAEDEGSPTFAPAGQPHNPIALSIRRNPPCLFSQCHDSTFRKN